MEETKAKGLIKNGDRVEGIKVESKEMGALELRAPIVVDASGRDCFAAHQAKVDDSGSTAQERSHCGHTLRVQSVIRAWTKEQPLWRTFPIQGMVLVYSTER